MTRGDKVHRYCGRGWTAHTYTVLDATWPSMTLIQRSPKLRPRWVRTDRLTATLPESAVQRRRRERDERDALILAHLVEPKTIHELAAACGVPYWQLAGILSSWHAWQKIELVGERKGLNVWKRKEQTR